MKTKTLELAIKKAEELSEPAQESIGRDMLERMEALAQLREELMKGIRQLDAGEGKKLDIEEFLKEAHARYAEKS